MGRFIYPPRPKDLIRSDQLPTFERAGGWLAQRKFDGDRCTVEFDAASPILWNRYGKPHRNVPPVIVGELRKLGMPAGTRLDGELLASKVVFFDALQVGDKYLYGETTAERLGRLSSLLGTGVDRDETFGYRVSSCLFVAESWHDQFLFHFNESLSNPFVEGLLLRQIQARLDSYGASYYEVGWQVRCRKPHKNYRR